MPTPESPNRRTLLRSLWLGGAWLLGPGHGAAVAGAAPPPGALGADAAAPGLTPWLRFEPDGRVRAYTNVADLGQGTWAALRMAVAHQLALPFDAVDIAPAPVDERHVNVFTRNYATFGSLGLRSGVATLAPAAALARSLLEQAAAQRWGIDVALCTARDGRVWAGERSLAFAELLPEAARLPAPVNGPGFEFTPAISADGQWLSFASTRGADGAPAADGLAHVWRVRWPAVLAALGLAAADRADAPAGGTSAPSR